MCPSLGKRNRLVDGSGITAPYRRVDALSWNVSEVEEGKEIKIRGFPAQKKVKLFRVTVSPHQTEFIVTNDLSQDSTQAARKECRVRWKSE